MTIQLDMFDTPEELRVKEYDFVFQRVEKVRKCLFKKNDELQKMMVVLLDKIIVMEEEIKKLKNEQPVKNSNWEILNEPIFEWTQETIQRDKNETFELAL